MLDKLVGEHNAELSAAALVSIAAFANGDDDAWTNAASAGLSRKLLGDHFRSREERRARFIAEDVLSDLLRPLFSGSRPATVTASGRRAEFVEPGRYDSASAEAEARKPWKYGRRYAIAVFEWALRHSDVSPSLSPFLNFFLLLCVLDISFRLVSHLPSCGM